MLNESDLHLSSNLQAHTFILRLLQQFLEHGVASLQVNQKVMTTDATLLQNMQGKKEPLKLEMPLNYSTERHLNTHEESSPPSICEGVDIFLELVSLKNKAAKWGLIQYTSLYFPLRSGVTQHCSETLPSEPRIYQQSIVILLIDLAAVGLQL